MTKSGSCVIECSKVVSFMSVIHLFEWVWRVCTVALPGCWGMVDRVVRRQFLASTKCTNCLYLCSGWVQRVLTVVSSTSTFPPMEQKLAVPLVGRSTLVVGVSLGLMHGSSTCDAPPAPSTIPRSCHWPRASSLNKCHNVWVALSYLTVPTPTILTGALWW